VPRYFFDVNDGVHIHDNDGVMLSSAAGVEHRAAAVLLRTIHDQRPKASSVPLVVTVRDQAGAPVYRVEAIVRSAWHAKPNE